MTTLDHITFLSQCNAREIRDAFLGKSEQPEYGATQVGFFLVACAQWFRVFTPPSERPTL